MEVELGAPWEQGDPVVAAHRKPRVPMACHDLAEPAEIADIGGRIVYNLRVFNVPVFCESHQLHQNISYAWRFWAVQKVVTGVRV